jgi:DNA-binding CsgD family transcriptional regulator
MAARKQNPKTRVALERLRDLRSSTFRVGGQNMLVISYAVDGRQPENLTPGEAEVASMAAAGLTNAEIASARGTATRTVANQMASILLKLGLSSRRELAALYHGLGRINARRP